MAKITIIESGTGKILKVYDNIERGQTYAIPEGYESTAREWTKTSEKIWVKKVK